MKVLMISGDEHVLSEGSDAARRLQIQRAALDKLTVFVWPQVHAWRHIWREAWRGDYDVITAQDPFYRGMLAWKLTWFTQAMLNLQVHADLSAQPWWRRAIARFALRRAHTVRAVSERVAAQVRAVGTKARISVLPVYVDLARFRNVIREPHEGSVLLWIGRFEKEKNPEEAIRILRDVLAEIPDAQLIMMGDGSLLEKVRQEARELPVTFTGRADPVKYLAQADVVLSTSPAESWGASIIEALAAGVPVVSRDVGVVREAGAIIAESDNFSDTVVRVLREWPEARLQMAALDLQEWAKAWCESLL